eukprot:1386953-Alexandrium_andersonii.AAC.1
MQNITADTLRTEDGRSRVEVIMERIEDAHIREIIKFYGASLLRYFHTGPLLKEVEARCHDIPRR